MHISDDQIQGPASTTAGTIGARASDGPAGVYLAPASGGFRGEVEAFFRLDQLLSHLDKRSHYTIITYNASYITYNSTMPSHLAEPSPPGKAPLSTANPAHEENGIQAECCGGTNPLVTITMRKLDGITARPAVRHVTFAACVCLK